MPRGQQWTARSLFSWNFQSRRRGETITEYMLACAASRRIDGGRCRGLGEGLEPRGLSADITLDLRAEG